MSDRVPFSLPGSLAPWVDTDHAIAVMGTAGDIVRVHALVTDAPSGDDLTFDLRDAAAGGGNRFATGVTISDGTKSATVTGTLDITASETVYLRLTEDAGAMNLSGWFEFDADVGGVGTLLTTLSRVKTHKGIAAGTTTFDAQLSQIILGVSTAFEEFCGRTFADTTYTDEVHDGSGFRDAIVLNQRPITTTTTMIVKLDDDAVDATLYGNDADEGIVYLANGVWSQGRRNLKVTYSAGYTTMPEDLVMAATAQVVHVFNQSSPGGARLGLDSNADASGGGTSYSPSDFLPEVLRTLRAYQRVG
jgi:hypothetical protein